jgi:hypothetical protein
MDSIHCKSKNDIYIYLVSNLADIKNNIFVGDYKQIMGFRKNLFISQVWYNDKTNKWGFNVSDDEFIGVCNMGEYDSFLQLLEGVANQYVFHWKLTN